jgi:superkiller protein 3
MTHKLRLLMLTTTALFAAALSAGCVTETHAQAKQAAVERWTSARTDIIFSLAIQAFENGDLDKAEKHCKHGIASNPKDPAFHDLYARVLIERGELERAFNHLEYALGQDENRAQTHYLFGVVFQRWQRYESALESYNKAHELQPDEVSYLLAAAEMMVKLGQSDQAVTRLEDKLVYFEHNAAIRVCLGRIHMMEHRYQPAVTMLREAALLAPDDLTTLEHLAVAEHAAGDFVEATYHLQKLLAEPQCAERIDLHLLLGDCYVGRNKLAEAGEVYLRTAKQDPDNAEAWIKVGQVAWLVDDDHHLRNAAEQTVHLAPKRFEGYLLRGMAYQRAGQSEAAVAQFEQAARLAPDRALPHVMKGMALEEDGNLRGAVQAYRQAMRVEPNDPRAKRLLQGLTADAAP